MSDLVDRVAMILYGGAPLYSDEPGREPKPIWDAARLKAKEIIAAMREPTEAMLAAGINAPDDPEHGQKYIDIWQDMIDEALK